jgi:hypothetical protein
MNVIEKIKTEFQTYGIWIVSAILGVIVLAFLPAFITVKNSPPPITNPDSPLGYSWSNLFWTLPALAIVLFFIIIKKPMGDKKAITISLVFLPILGFVLDIFFAGRFFTFENTASVWGIYIKGFDFETMSFTYDIPVEEFIFYVTGFLFCLVMYLFSSNFWLEKYNVEPESVPSDALLKLNKEQKIVPLAVCGGFLVVGFILRAIFKTPQSNPLPEYYIFLVIFGILPAALCYPGAKHLVNWQAFSFTTMTVLLISVIWEATLGIPYGWWGYHPEPMIGLFIKPWSNLPIESVIVWFCVNFTTIFFFERIRLYFRKKK